MVVMLIEILVVVSVAEDGDGGNMNQCWIDSDVGVVTGYNDNEKENGDFRFYY